MEKNIKIEKIILNCNTNAQYFCFYCVLGQFNAALVSTTSKMFFFFKKKLFQTFDLYCTIYNLYQKLNKGIFWHAWYIVLWWITFKYYITFIHQINKQKVNSESF